MRPSEVPSDIDVEEVSDDELLGRLTILQDVGSDFGGLAGAYAIMSIFVPALMFGTWYLDLAEAQRDPIWVLLISAVFIVALISISLYSLVWSCWANKRIKLTEQLREKRFASVQANE